MSQGKTYFKLPGLIDKLLHLLIQIVGCLIYVDIGWKATAFRNCRAFQGSLVNKRNHKLTEYLRLIFEQVFRDINQNKAPFIHSRKQIHFIMRMREHLLNGMIGKYPPQPARNLLTGSVINAFRKFFREELTRTSIQF